MLTSGRHVVRLLSFTALVAVSACANPQVAPVVNVRPQGLSINQSTPSQRIENPARDKAGSRPTTLEQLREVRSYKNSGTASGDRINAPMLKANATRYGLQGGLAWGAAQAEEVLRDRATELGRTYDFNALARRDVNNKVLIMPPVISEIGKYAEVQENSRVLRISDASYIMLKKAQIVQRAPIWQSYMDMEACCGTSPEEPGDPLPRNDAERDLWRRYVTEGWNMGLVQAQDTFQEKLRAMQTDFTGMVLSRKLVDEGKMSDVMVAETNLGTTGNGDNMRVNDVVVRITRDPHFNVGSGRDWKPAVGTTPVAEAAVPAGEAQPQPRTAEARRGGRIVPGSRPGRVPVAAQDTPAPSSSDAVMPDMTTSRGY